MCKDHQLTCFQIKVHSCSLLMAMFHFPGAMALICDVNEYRKAVSSFKQPLVNSLFDTLHTLCKLLQVSPENLKVVCSGDQLVVLEDLISLFRHNRFILYSSLILPKVIHFGIFISKNKSTKCMFSQSLLNIEFILHLNIFI